MNSYPSNHRVPALRAALAMSIGTSLLLFIVILVPAFRAASRASCEADLIQAQADLIRALTIIQAANLAEELEKPVQEPEASERLRRRIVRMELQMEAVR